MNTRWPTFTSGKLGVLGSVALLAISCNNPTQSPPPAPVAPPSEVGRYQIVVSTEGDRGSILFLVDTKEGATWIYRAPQGPAINGFWSDIPRLTYAPDYWQRAFSQQQPAPGQQPQVQTPPPSPGTLPAEPPR